MYLRFIVCDRARLRGSPRGIFRSAYRILERPGLATSDRDELGSMLSWFEKELPIPDDDAFPDGRGLCWFKPGARNLIERLWRMCEVLRGAGFRSRQVYNRDPGLVTYQDDYQIVAVGRFTSHGRWPF